MNNVNNIAQNGLKYNMFSGKMHAVPCNLKGQYVIRFTLTSPKTTVQVLSHSLLFSFHSFFSFIYHLYSAPFISLSFPSNFSFHFPLITFSFSFYFSLISHYFPSFSIYFQLFSFHFIFLSFYFILNSIP